MTTSRSLFHLIIWAMVCICPGSLALADDSRGTIAPIFPRCEYRINPTGVDSPHPRLDWNLQAVDSTARGLAQSAYQIVAASSSGLLGHDQGDFWDTGKVTSDQTTQILYAGKPLLSAQPVWWKVKVWDQTGHSSEWSPVGQWTMGLLADTDWAGAKWIGAQEGNPVDSLNGTTRLRRKLEIRPGLKNALIFICGLGQYEVNLDGVKVGQDLLEPGWTNYQKTCLYGTYDITDQLQATGSHRLELLLGNGFYNLPSAPGRYTKFTESFGPRKAIALVRLEYNNGTVTTVGSDGSWETAPGAMTFSNVYAGEDYDARLENPAQTPTSWDPATVLPAPGGKLLGANHSAPPIRANQVFKPVSVKELKPGVRLYDLGQNASIMPTLVANGPAGSSIRMIPSEQLKADGSLDRRSCGGGAAWWQYTLAGAGDESFFPKFFYHGSRYLQVELTPATAGGDLPTVQSVEAVAVHSSTPSVGEFSCSNDLFNHIYRLVRWAQVNNMVSLLTDCPHRERLGWLEEDNLNGPSLRYDFDLAALYSKIMRDMADAQTDEGLIPDLVPEYTKFKGGFRDSSEWGSSVILVPWQQYQFTGDTSLLSEYYETMKRYLAYLQNKASDNTIGGGLGDWFDIGPKGPGKSQLTPIENTDTCFYYADAKVMSEIAKLLGKEDDAKRFADLAETIRTSFNQHFFNSETGEYSTGSQSSNSIPLVLGIPTPEHREAILNNIVQDIKNHGTAFTTGEIGYRFLLRALADSGHSDLVYEMNNQTDKPGYGMQIAKGRTSLTEQWDGGTNPFASLDHFMSGEIVEWLFHDLAGIQRDETEAAFKKIIIKPAIVGDLTWVKASYDSVQGKIVSEWKRSGTTLTLDITIPVNTTATIYVPAKDAAAVMENGRLATQSPGITFLRFEAPNAAFIVGSGAYHFTSQTN